MKFLIILATSILCYGEAFAQSKIADSLIKLTNTKTIHDTIKVKIYGDISWEFLSIDYDKAKLYATKSLDLATKINNIDAIAQAESDLANVYLRMSDADNAFLHYNKSLALRIKQKNEFKKARVLFNMGRLYENENRYDSAAKIMYNSIISATKCKDSILLGKAYTSLASIYYKLRQSNLSVEYLDKAIEIATNINDYRTLVESYLLYSGIYIDKKELDSALIILKYGEEILLQMPPLNRENSILYSNFAQVYMYKKNFKKSLSYAIKSYDIKIALQDSFQIAKSEIQIADIYKNLNDADKAISYLLKAEPYIKKAKQYQNLYIIYGYLSECYELKNDFKTASKFLSLYGIYKDSVFTQNSNNQILELKTQYDVEKKDLALKNQLLELRKNQLINYALLAIIPVILLLSFLLYNRYKLKQKAILINTLLEQQEQKTIAIIETEEKERQRIARELHDGVAQTIAAAKLNLASIQSDMKFENEMFSKRFDNALVLIDSSAKEVRTVSHSMMPNALIKNGLAQAVREFVNQLTSASKFSINLDIVGLNNKINENIESIYYRILQESLNNIIKHANASEINISIINENNQLTMLIEDNGNGFETKNIQNGIGLKNMQSRMKFIKGTLSIESALNKGTSILAIVPLN